MVSISRGEVWWADLSEPFGSTPGYRRPVLIVQGDRINRSRSSTVVCVPLTGNLVLADAPGNVILEASLTGLPQDSVVNVSQIVTLDRQSLTERVGKIPIPKLELILTGIDVILGGE
jgi:mRNA interferase MazF